MRKLGVKLFSIFHLVGFNFFQGLNTKFSKIISSPSFFSKQKLFFKTLFQAPKKVDNRKLGNHPLKAPALLS